MLLTVEAVIVFGSFLGRNEKLGDLDIAVTSRPRDPKDPDPSATALAYAERSGRHFGNIVQRLSWPDTEPRQILKARKRSIAIQDWDTFLKLELRNADHFRYTVRDVAHGTSMAELGHGTGGARCPMAADGRRLRGNPAFEEIVPRWSEFTSARQPRAAGAFSRLSR